MVRRSTLPMYTSSLPTIKDGMSSELWDTYDDKSLTLTEYTDQVCHARDCLYPFPDPSHLSHLLLTFTFFYLVTCLSSRCSCSPLPLLVFPVALAHPALPLPLILLYSWSPSRYFSVSYCSPFPIVLLFSFISAFPLMSPSPSLCLPLPRLYIHLHPRPRFHSSHTIVFCTYRFLSYLVYK